MLRRVLCSSAAFQAARKFSCRALSSTAVSELTRKQKVGEPWPLKDSWGCSKKAEQFYDAYAENYEATLRHQGYDNWEMSARIVDEVLRRDQNSPDRTSLRLLDIGTGCGMVGVELSKVGFTNSENMYAHDLSTNMLAMAKKRNVFGHFLKENLLMNSLKLPDSSIDIVTAIGVATYLEPRVLNEFLRVLKPKSGFYVLAAKTTVKPPYIKFQDELVKMGAATLVVHWANQNFLPNNPNPEIAAEHVDYFVYRKT